MAARASIRMCSYIVVALVFSMPPKMKSLTTTWAYLLQGYGVPVSFPKCSIICGVRTKVRSPSASRPAGKRYWSGRFSGSDAVASICANSPATTVSR